jgi:hypothetical protein
MAQTEILTRYDVVKSGKDGWELKTGGKTVAWRGSKTALVDDLQATLDRVGDGDGTVRIHTEIGGIEEERTYPRSKDPRKSPG